MSGGIRTSVKGYINAKRATLTLDKTALQSETENETIHSSLPQAAECVVIPEASTASNALSIISRIPRLLMPSFALCFKGTKDHEGIQIASGLYSPSMLQNLVIRVIMQNERQRCVLMKKLCSVAGVSSVALEVKDEGTTLTTRGINIDPVYMVSKLRKYCYTEIVSVSMIEIKPRTVSIIETVEALSETTTVEPLEEGKKDEGRKNQFNQCLEKREEHEQDKDYREKVFTRVMGPDAHGHVRMYGTGITPSQVFGQSSRSSYVNEDTIREEVERQYKTKIDDLKAKHESEIGDLRSKYSEVSSELHLVMTHIGFHVNTSPSRSGQALNTSNHQQETYGSNEHQTQLDPEE